MSSQTTGSISTFQRLLRYLKPYKAGFALAMLGMAGYACVDVYFISQFSSFIDRGITQKDMAYLAWAPVFVVGMFFLRGVFHFISSYCLTWAGTHIVKDLRQQLFRQMIALPVSYHDKHSTGELISKITYDAEQIKQASSKALMVLIHEGVFVLGCLGLMFYNSWQLSLIFLVIAPVIAVIVTQVSKRFRKISSNMQNAMGDVTTSSEQMLNGHKVILSFGSAELENARFKAVNNRNRQLDVKMEATRSISVSLVQLIASFALAFVIYLASFPAMLDTLTPGTFSEILAAMMLLLKPLKQLTTVNSDFQRGMAAATNVFLVLDEKPEQDTGTLELGQVKGAIEIKNLSFNYPGHEKQVLKQINIKVEPGQTAALVGRSGSGKTTISNLLPRFYEIEQGEILLDGINTKDCTLDSLRGQMAVVSQQVVLFNDTIANNIAYGYRGELSREHLINVAEKAHVMEFVSQMPQGLDTEIGENGVTLSGGQRQRIAIARALLRQAPVLILDEATSALDTESERKIQGALEELFKGRTSIVIAHRLSTIENADQILVMDQGQIVEQGTHQSLLAQNGYYAQLYKMQFSEA
ncbi:lipid A export permease/ATP-binding protein MsbA [Rheinheimera sp. 1928-s]|uniref:lipid A export permease/ATP-binding protein MsbA n=1 Tax=Rheinheimera sp. 1928-s TaxID=3033803 RepID=UPI002613BCD5|nr:lipid A export permease/ATP-binding protein MsbA [Rheinheimera sp. 1928-s]MDF3125483.1 lipid A export permease/ATP-binding protein MsbA [Rheinheimera sp. 1928-s]